jgi:hypothetical protein
VQDDGAYARAKRIYLAAALGIAGGLAVAGSFDANTGGVIVVASWALAVWALHHLGRTGSTRERA